MSLFDLVVTTEGTRWDHLAAQHYGNPFAFPLLIAANPHLPVGDFLPPGSRMAVPVLPEADVQAQAATEELPPWKR